MTEEVIQKGIWGIEKFNHLNCNSVTEIEGFKSESKLRLFITQLGDRSSYQQNKLIGKWCEYLPTLKRVEYLWLLSRVNQKIFNAICKMGNLKGLWIKWSGIKDISNVENLQTLEHFHLGSSSQIQSITVLGRMKNLITLETEQLNKISDFSPLSNLVKLEGLGVDGSIWTAQKINNLRFLEPLKNLKYFTMTNTRLKEKSFDPILKLNNLVRFNSSWNYPEIEFKKLKAHPTLKYGNIETSWKKLKADLDKKIKEKGW